MIKIIRYDLALRLFREGKISLEQGVELCGKNKIKPLSELPSDI